MKHKNEEQDEWRQELDAALADDNKAMPSWQGSNWRQETQSFFSSLPVAYNTDYYKSTTTQDISRWKKGADYTYSYSFTGGGSEKEIAMIIADAVVRTANAPCNHQIRDENGKEQFLTLQIGGNLNDPAGLANTCLSPAVYLSSLWIRQACMTGGLGASAAPDAAPSSINEKINKLSDAYTGQALVLATAKKTMDPEVAKAARELVRNASLINGAIASTNKEAVETAARQESGLSLWRNAEYEAAKRELLKDWPGFDSYTNAAQSMHPASKVEEAINSAMADVAGMEAYIEARKKEMKDPVIGLTTERMARQVEMMAFVTRVRSATTALNHVTSGRKEKIKLPKEVLDCVKHVIKQPVAHGTTLDQAQSVGQHIVDYFKKKEEEPPKEEEKQPGDGDPDPGNTEAGEDPKGNGEWSPTKGAPETDRGDEAGEIGKLPSSDNHGRDGEGVQTSMQPTEISVKPEDLCKEIKPAGAITKGFMIDGFAPATLAQKELMRQMAEPIARVVRSKVQFRSSSPSFNVVGLRRGEIDDGNLYLANHDPRVFCRNEEVTRPTVAVGMLLDQSGSMNDMNKSGFTPDMVKLNGLQEQEFPGIHRDESFESDSILKYNESIFRTKFGRKVSRFGFNALLGRGSGSHLIRADQVAGVAAGIYLGLSTLPGVELFLSGFYTGEQNAVSKRGNRKDVIHAPTPLKQFQQTKNDGQYPMQLFEYASRKVGKLKNDQLFARLCNVRPNHANADGFAIMHAAARMNELYPDVRMKVLFVLSDGQPSSSYHDMVRVDGHWQCSNEYLNYGGHLAMRHIRDVCRWSGIHQGVMVKGIGIDNAYSVIEGRVMFGENNFTVLGDIESSAAVIAAFLARTFHKLGT